MNALQQYLDRFQMNQQNSSGGTATGALGSVPVRDAFTPEFYRDNQYRAANAQRLADLQARQMESDISNNELIARSFGQTSDIYGKGPEMPQYQAQPMYQFGRFNQMQDEDDSYMMPPMRRPMGRRQFGGGQMGRVQGGNQQRNNEIRAPQFDMQIDSTEFDQRPVPSNALARMMVR
jgi:hypothetical protein